VRIFGIDLTSAPSARKPITCAHAEFDGRRLHVNELVRWESFDGFDALLGRSGPWVSAMDFPFAQSRRLVENIGWPRIWEQYVGLVGSMSRSEFRSTLEAYRAPRAAGDKHHKRRCDTLSGSQSPQTIDYTPVGLMFFEGAPRLLSSGVHLPHLRRGDPQRVVVEGYPGVAARRLIGRVPYKQDQARKQTPAQHRARRAILERLLEGKCEDIYGFSLTAPMAIADDPSGDELDALLCAVQASWGWTRREENFGAPVDCDPLEGWICDPALLDEVLLQRR